MTTRCGSDPLKACGLAAMAGETPAALLFYLIYSY
jgi:hypothetical protein